MASVAADAECLIVPWTGKRHGQIVRSTYGPIPIIRALALTQAFAGGLQPGDLAIKFPIDYDTALLSMKDGHICEMIPLTRIETAPPSTGL